jgi:iron complex transport system substrate-binding protein
VLGHARERSRVVAWEEVGAARPDVVVTMPCGYDAARSAEEARTYGEQLARLGADTVVAVDASAYFSRPGPRLVTGIEVLAHILHPDHVESPGPGKAIDLDYRQSSVKSPIRSSPDAV